MVANSPPFIHKFIHSERQQENTGQKMLFSFLVQKTNSPPFIPKQISVLNEVLNSNTGKVNAFSKKVCQEWQVCDLSREIGARQHLEMK